jgi:hypothetical protein
MGGDFHGNRIGGEFHDRDHDGDHHFRERFGGGGFAYVPGYNDYYDYSDSSSDSTCYQYQNVYTPGGWQWRQVWVCN